MPTKIDPSQVVWDTPVANDQNIQWDDQPPAPETPPMSWGDAAAQGVQNIPASAGRMVKDLAYPLTNFDEFATGMKSLFSGDEAATGALKQMIIDRYGGEEQLKRTIAQDPVGLLSDLSLLLTGGGAVVKGAGTLAKVPALAKAGAGISGAAAAIDPINAAVKGAGTVVKGIGKVPGPIKLTPEGMYASALKRAPLSNKITAEDLDAAAKTGLKYDIPLSMSGGDKVESLLGTIDQQIGAFIDTKAAAGDAVSRRDVLRELYKTKQPGGYLYDTPYRDVVEKRVNKLMRFVENNYPEEIPVKTVQKMKTDMQHFLAKQYGTETKSINVATDKTYARGARLALAEKYPELDLMNMTAKELHEFEKIFDPALARVMSRDLAGIGGAIKTGAGASLDQLLGTQGLFTMTGALESVLDTPRVKAWTARRLFKLRNKKASQRGAVGYATRETLRQTGRAGAAVEEE